MDIDRLRVAFEHDPSDETACRAYIRALVRQGDLDTARAAVWAFQGTATFLVGKTWYLRSPSVSWRIEKGQMLLPFEPKPLAWCGLSFSTGASTVDDAPGGWVSVEQS